VETDSHTASNNKLNDLTQFLDRYGNQSVLLVALKIDEIHRYEGRLEDIGACITAILERLPSERPDGFQYRVDWRSFLFIATEGSIMNLARQMTPILRDARMKWLVSRCAIVEMTGDPHLLFDRWDVMLGESLTDFIKRDVKEEIQIIDGKLLESCLSERI
jgi:hypothetical protein